MVNFEMTPRRSGICNFAAPVRVTANQSVCTRHHTRELEVNEHSTCTASS
jgi:hypothetical protein